MKISKERYFSYKITSVLDRLTTPCSRDVFGEADLCKVSKVRGRDQHRRTKTGDLFQFSEDLREHFNCTVPWLQYFREDLRICGPDLRSHDPLPVRQLSMISFQVTRPRRSTCRTGTPSTLTALSPAPGWTSTPSLRSKLVLHHPGSGSSYRES